MASIYIKIIYLGVVTTRPHEGIYRTLTYLKLSSVSLSSPHPSPFLFEQVSQVNTKLRSTCILSCELMRVISLKFVKRMTGCTEESKLRDVPAGTELKI